MRPQLLFVYLHKYRNIYEQGFNLSSGFQFTFSPKHQKGKFSRPKLTVVANEQTIPHLFDHRFIDIKGIVGENGAGKSTLMQYLAFQCHQHPDYVEYPKSEFRDILIYSTGDPANPIGINIGKDWVQGEQLNLSGFEALGNVNIHECQDLTWEDMHRFPFDVIYYSNIFDNKSEYNYGSLKNISTNFLIRQDAKDFLNRPDVNAEVTIGESVAYSFQEDSRRLSFALRFKNLLPFPLPDHVLVYYNRTARADLSSKRRAIELDRRKNGRELSALYNEWLEKTNAKRLQTPTFRAQFQQQFFDYFILNYLLGESDMIRQTFKQYPAFRVKVFEKLNSLFNIQSGINDLRVLIDFAKKEEVKINHNKLVQLGDSELSRPLESFYELDRMLSSVFDTNVHFATGFKLAIDERTLDIQDQYKRTLYITDYLNFNFAGMSSGEFGFLTLFSRFYSLVDHRNFAGTKLQKKNLLILLDEGDLYFHPKWQVKFLDFINTIFPLIFSDNQNIQLILTSHSPFIASDLPSGNLLFLKKGDIDNRLPFSNESANGKCLVATAPEYTFGANVHELLADSFFLEGAHIGQLAKKTIYQIVDQLEDNNLKPIFTKKEIVKIIGQIGEPWVRSRLTEQYEAFYENEETL